MSCGVQWNNHPVYTIGHREIWLPDCQKDLLLQKIKKKKIITFSTCEFHGGFEFCGVEEMKCGVVLRPPGKIWFSNVKKRNGGTYRPTNQCLSHSVGVNSSVQVGERDNSHMIRCPNIVRKGLNFVERSHCPCPKLLLPLN